MNTNWKHQDDALEFLMNRMESGHSGSMLGMDMGTGKSRVAIQFFDVLDCQVVIVIGPKVILDVWPDQFKAHSERDWYVHAVNGKKSVAERMEQSVRRMALAHDMGRPYALIVNYEAAWREPFSEWIIGQHWDGAAYDESHRIKAPGGKASRFVSRMKRATQTRLCLTGTPMPHSPLDLYAQWRALDTSVFGTSFQRFKSRYAIEQAMERQDGRSYTQVVGYRHMDELEARAGEGTFVVHKRDVMDLPPVTHEVIPVDLSPATMRQYREFKKELVLEFGDTEVTVDNALVKLLRLQQITSGYVKADDGTMIELGTEKRSALYDWMEDVPQDEPIVAFCRFTRDLANVHKVTEEHGRQYLELSGQANSLVLWQRATKGEVLGVQIQSGSVGIDLTRAAYGMYYSLGFNLGDYDQSLARLDRPGQTRPVTLYHLLARDTVDEDVMGALRKRSDVVKSVVNGMRGH